MITHINAKYTARYRCVYKDVESIACKIKLGMISLNVELDRGKNLANGNKTAKNNITNQFFGLDAFLQVLKPAKTILWKFVEPPVLAIAKACSKPAIWNKDI